MIDTIVTKDQQLRNGYFQTGTGPKEILILGSCRTVPYVNYLNDWNKGAGNNALTIRRIDPCDWAFSNIDLATLETDQRIFDVLFHTEIFIHEYLVNYGMFNTEKSASKNIYQFGVDTADLDISIPNFNDHLILENDWVDYGAVTPPDYQERGEAEIEKFCSHCDHSSFHEFSKQFRDTWRVIRYFWRPNHVSAAFTRSIFQLMDKNFLHLGAETTPDDLFKDPHTAVTQRDRDGYQLKW